MLKFVFQSLHAYLLLEMATPKLILNKMLNFQCNFLFWGTERNRKWSLVAWDKIYCLEKGGDLGLCDPNILSITLSAKTWWRWIKNSKALWSKMWRCKYALNTQESQLIRMTGNIISGMLLGATNVLLRSIVSGKLEIGTMHCSGMTCGINDQN